jgi:hypothetical protein
MCCPVLKETILRPACSSHTIAQAQGKRGEECGGTTQERKFLGFSFTGGPDIKRKIAPKSLERFKQRNQTSKWNKIEHRLFSFITMNWRGKPSPSHRF